MRYASVPTSANSGRMPPFRPKITVAPLFARNYVIKSFAIRQTIGANSLIARSYGQQENF
jgi:hypothetical protein